MMDKKRRKRKVFKNQASAGQSVASSATNRRLFVERHAAPPRSPEKARPLDNFDFLMGFDEGGGFEPQEIEREGPAVIKVKVKKKKRYQNSDHPLKTWIPYRDEYCDALIELKGRGGWWTNGCAVCHEKNPTWRCADCFGRRMICMACTIERHQDQPLHLLEEWEDDHFHDRTCRDLGIRYQIGHPFGEECPFLHVPRPTTQENITNGKGFVVLHNNGIHVLDLDFCGCPGAPPERKQLLDIGWYPATPKNPSTAATLSLLRHFHKLNLQARLPAYDFYNTLVILTNAAGLKKLPNRLPQFMTMVREYRHLEMCKHAGRAHAPEGIEGTKPGELAEACQCRACPIPGVNLPENWAEAPPEITWIYRLMLSEDANFKMKGRDRSSRAKDPTLGPGWAYMVASDAYLRFLVKHVEDDEINHCVSFAALWSANNKHSKGLRASRIGSVSCSRHELFRPLGTGDLQKGEKYSNMDYIFFSSIINITLLTIIASYDIACQWGRNFWKRAKEMPPELQLPDWLEIIFKVPKFHLPLHVKKCHGPYSFNFTKGVGRTDGEGVERNWSWLNWAARSVSVMGPGSREDTIDDLCGFSNWKKTVDLGNSLLRKMVLAIPQAMIHSRAFHSFTNGLCDGHEEDLHKWEKMVRAWEVDATLECPYDYAEVEANTMAEVMHRFSEEEHARVVRNGAAALQVKPAAFLMAGIQIQESQAAVRLDATWTCKTTIQATSLQRARTLLLGKVSALHDVQGTYMPGLRQWLGQQNPPLPEGSTARPETISIYLPSSLAAEVREAVCVPDLTAQEELLRMAQAGEALHDLRSGLRTRTFAHQFQRKHLEGQEMYTRSRELLDAIEDHVRVAASRDELRELIKEDIRGMNEHSLNADEKEENRKACERAGLPVNGDEANVDEYGEPVDQTVFFNLETGEGRRRMSWIWFTGKIDGTDVGPDGRLHEDIRVEWAKARACADRWREEVILLDEEMRRVLQYCTWKAQWWDERVAPVREEGRAAIGPELAEGLRAYALVQASREREWAITWEVKWRAVRVRAELVLRDHITQVTDEVLVPLEVELEDEDEEEDLYDGFDEEEDLF
ncbi:hypothetical protein DFH07DRAFT_957248 [Mycena maculata]|uniref:CxC2-like cysteine cluster KDZ transposase-associated domain-containing protein n=1 Tax=Mycena maculata TaxID=230809 RepID=A0AAD7NIA3_9AGAR|nr:hypothetical protein DFH07DRAFT_957248 [Mycena maculata]